MNEFFTMEQVARRFHKSRRWLQDYLRESPCDKQGEPFYRLAGRTKLFSEADIGRLYASLPAPVNAAAPKRTRLQRQRGPKRANDLAEALRLVEIAKERRRSKNQK